ncbi:MAG: CDGSH iron-sulfur domain-containing protein [Thermoleophilaceae bacterium]
MDSKPPEATASRPAVIKATHNGPLRVKGPITLVDADGTPYEVKRKTFFLCRCGASAAKPFCDGSHSRIGFEAEERAEPDAAAQPDAAAGPQSHT